MAEASGAHSGVFNKSRSVHEPTCRGRHIQSASMQGWYLHVKVDLTVDDNNGSSSESPAPTPVESDSDFVKPPEVPNLLKRNGSWAWNHGRLIYGPQWKKRPDLASWDCNRCRGLGKSLHARSQFDDAHQ